MIDDIWNKNLRGTKEITLNKYLKYIGDQKIVSNAQNDKHKVEELFKGILIGPWGSRFQGSNSPERIQEGSNSPKNQKIPTSLSTLDSITRVFFE